MNSSFLKCVFFASALVFCNYVAQGATITVTTTSDSGPGSLRQALADSNANAQGDTIVFDSKVFSTPRTILLTSGELRIHADPYTSPFGNGHYPISIIGPGPGLLTIDANNQSRIFYSESGAFSFNGLTLTHGRATYGGAVYSVDGLVVSNSVITDNIASGAESNGYGHYGGQGGAIFAHGLTITGTTLRNNTATGVGLEGSGVGGAIFTLSANIVDCAFINNMAKGVDIPTPETGLRVHGTWGYAGALFSQHGSLIVNSRFINNSAIGGHGSFEYEGSGGGAQGGAIIASGVRILNSTFSDNVARGGNGSTKDTYGAPGRGGEATGGAIFDYGNSRMANVTIVRNSATGGSGKLGGDALGGGIHFRTESQWQVSNLTVTNNTAAAGMGTQTNGLAQGGGAFIGAPSSFPASLRNSIFADNTAASGPDIFGGSPNANNNLIRIGDGFTGASNGVNGNLIGTNAIPIEPLLAPLGDNGGVSQTRALLEGSPAIGAGDNSVINPITMQPEQTRPLLMDQRNFQRVWPAGGIIDIGAYEFGSPSVPVPTTAADLRSEHDTGTSNSDNITKSNTASFDVADAIPGATVELLRDGVVVSIDRLPWFSSFSPLSRRLADPSPPQDATVQYTVRQSIGGNTSALSAPLTVTFDQTAPTGTINQAASQADPVNSTPVNFTAAFNERVSSPGLISFQGSTANVTGNASSSTTDGGLTFRVQVFFVNSNGQTVVANLGNFQDLAGNSGTALPSTDNSVTLDNVRPAVTINQAADQSDPTNILPVRYRVIFSEPVDGLLPNDFLFTGSTVNTSAAVLEIAGSGTTYDVAVSGISAPGRLRLAVRQGAAFDAFQNPNNLSTSTDNSVTLMPAAATISGRVAAQDGRGLARAFITVTAADGSVLYAQSNHFGFFRIFNVPTGNLTFTITRKPNFTYTRDLFLSEDLTGFDFGLP